jgi:hypothetical protein
LRNFTNRNMKQILTIERIAVLALVFFWGYWIFRQQRIDEAQDRRMEEWMSNTAATLEGMEYEMTRLKNAIDTTATYGK